MGGMAKQALALVSVLVDIDKPAAHNQAHEHMASPIIRAHGSLSCLTSTNLFEAV